MDPSTSFEPPTHNYLKWLKALLKYYKSLSPALADSTEQFLNQLNIDDFIHGRHQIHYPQLDDDDYPDLIKVSAMTAITASVSSDFSHLIDEDTMVDIFPSLVNLHCTCRPNSDDDRANQLISFWDLRQNSTETVSFFGNKLRAASKAFNDASSSGDKISDSQLAAALKNGIKKGAQSERFAHALMTMKYKISNPPFDSMLLWLDQNCDRTKSVDTVSQGQQASAARTRGGARGGKGDKGRGGSTRGGGKGGKSRAVRAEDNGTAVWNQTYYKVEDADGSTPSQKKWQTIAQNAPVSQCLKTVNAMSQNAHTVMISIWLTADQHLVLLELVLLMRRKLLPLLLLLPLFLLQKTKLLPVPPLQLSVHTTVKMMASSTPMTLVFNPPPLLVFQRNR